MKTKLLMTLLTLTTFSTTYARTLVASKTGDFDKFRTCTLYNDAGVISYSEGIDVNLEQTTQIPRPFIQFPSDFSKIALDAASSPRFRWAIGQTDYNLSLDGKTSKTFYAEGFRFVSNHSQEALMLRQEIDHLCEDRLDDYKIIGDFFIYLKIGEKLFEDELIIKRVNENFGTRVRGDYIVPNSFTSNISKLRLKDNQFSFVIRVKERNDDYEAIFEGKVNSQGELEGSSYILPERKLLGHFTSKRKK